MAVCKIETGVSLRPCVLLGNKAHPDERALFHRWVDRAYIVPPSPMVGGDPGGQMWNVYGLVELEDGSVIKVPASSIRFLDNRFGDYSWEKKRPITDSQ